MGAEYTAARTRDGGASKYGDTLSMLGARTRTGGEPGL